ncbi:questin oxidase family protein, partial [Streptomyces albidus (ex Kaewkla and Franco 2022)]|uniref:questin oxidase family protein n=1 Tax=Streptomyces albidus (ex Kaewkla and Franco 2022) TaxID=722709 RepID=UPI0015EEF12F
MDIHGSDSSGTLDEALERLHRSGPERDGWLSNHAPMAVEALVRHGKASAVHRWLDLYRDNLEDMPAPSSPVTEADWHEALGDPRRLADWIVHFARALDSRPWRGVLTEWWPRLLPGISASATHPVIRAGHAVRTLLDEERLAGDRPGEGPRLTELAHALGYWAARHQPLPGLDVLPTADSAAAGLAAVPRVDQSGGIRERLARITALPARPTAAARAGAAGSTDAEQARADLKDLVRAATHRYATHAHESPVMLVHAATAPNAVLRTLPA